jgi:ABC-type glycerol-3-phosphate transport system substrate-binding protein
MKRGRVHCGLAILTLLTLAFSTNAQAATEIVYWDLIKPGDGTPRGNALGKNIERFHAKYPDIRVKVETVPPTSIEPNLIQGAAAGSTPDVIRIFISNLPLHISAGSIQPLDKFAEKMDKTDWLLPWQSTLVTDGKKYALPYEYRFFGLLYRKDILQKAGVKVPTTWDEVCSAGGKINSPQVMGYGMGLSKANNAYYLLEWVEVMFAEAGGQIFGADGKIDPNNPAGLKFFHTIRDLAGKCGASGKAVVEFTYNHVDEGLKAGTIAMAGLGTYRLPGIRTGGAGENADWAPVPTYEKGKPAPAMVTGWTLTMGKHAKNPDAAWKFMEFMTSPETQVVIAQGGESPTRKSPYNDPWFKTPGGKLLAAWGDYMSKSGRTNQYPTTWFDFGQILAESTQSIVLQGITPEKAWASLAERYNSLRK